MKLTTIRDWRNFNKGRKILILKGEWEGEETDFVDMVYQDGSIPLDNEKPSEKLRMKVRTRFGTELLLKPGQFMIIDKKIMQQGNKN
jgi:hypothetical protein